MTDVTTWQLIQTAYPYVLSYIAGHGGSILLSKIKLYVHRTRQTIDLIDSALNDPNVTDAQFKAIWDSSKQLLSK